MRTIICGGGAGLGSAFVLKATGQHPGSIVTSPTGVPTSGVVRRTVTSPVPGPVMLPTGMPVRRLPGRTDTDKRAGNATLTAVLAATVTGSLAGSAAPVIVLPTATVTDIVPGRVPMTFTSSAMLIGSVAGRVPLTGVASATIADSLSGRVPLTGVLSGMFTDTDAGGAMVTAVPAGKSTSVTSDDGGLGLTVTLFGIDKTPPPGTVKPAAELKIVPIGRTRRPLVVALTPKIAASVSPRNGMDGTGFAVMFDVVNDLIGTTASAGNAAKTCAPSAAMVIVSSVGVIVMESVVDAKMSTVGLVGTPVAVTAVVVVRVNDGFAGIAARTTAPTVWRVNDGSVGLPIAVVGAIVRKVMGPLAETLTFPDAGPVTVSGPMNATFPTAWPLTLCVGMPVSVTGVSQFWLAHGT